MKMKKVVCLLLAAAMLLSLNLIFAACSERVDQVKRSKKRQDIDLTEYALVYPQSYGEIAALKKIVVNFADTLSGATGLPLVANSDDKTRSTAADPEILIGLTKREESQKAYKSIKGDGFVVQLIGNKIVIVGSSQLLTVQALQYFSDTYLTAGAAVGSTLSVHQKASANEMEMVVLANSTESFFRYIYDDKLDDSVVHEYVHSAGGDHRDFPVIAIDELVATAAREVGLSAGKFSIRTDKSEKSTKEFLMGYVNREACKELRAKLGACEYGFFVGSEDIVCTSYSDAALMTCQELVKGLISLAVFTDDAGQPYVAFPNGFSLRGYVNENWITDFPKPDGEGIELYNTMDANDSSLQYLYKGDGINAENYNAYCEKLKTEGYVLQTSSTAGENLFSTFINQEKGVVLHVNYNAFAFADDYTYDKGEYYFVDPNFRITSTPLATAYLPDEKLLTKQSYVKKTDSKTTAIPLVSAAVGMGYVVTLEDGSFILFDGGFASNDGAPTHTKIWSILSSLHKEITKAEVSTTNPIHIAAWVVTHSHSDHYEAFEDFLSAYGQTKKVKMDYLLGSFPSLSSCYSVRDGVMHLSSTNAIKGLQTKVTGGFKYVKVHAGQRYHLANLEIEVITTFEDLNPLRINNSNDTCTVLRFHLSNQDAPGAKPVTQMWTGDANRNQSRYIAALYGSYLQSDMVQVAHHGNIGCEIPFYDCVNPTVVWFPHTAEAFRSYTAQGNQSAGWQYAVDYHLVNKVPNVKYIYVSDTYHTTV
ncbi:MAG: hypothetical protein IJW22_07710, partial [Clostridia bacterium]|nr:hypothetical protein [Clostridia bacterium]